MSDLSRVLPSTVRAEVANIDQMIFDIVYEIGEHKGDATKYIDRLKYIERPSDNQNLLNKAAQLVNEANKLENEIGEISKTDPAEVANTVDAYKNELCEIVSKLKVSSQLVHINEILFNIGKLHQAKEYAKEINEFKEILEYITPICDEGCLDVFVEQKAIVLKEQRYLMEMLLNIFDENVEYCEKMPYVLKVRMANDEFCQALLALAAYDSYIESLDAVSGFLWNFVFSPIINHKTTVEQQVHEFCTLNVTVNSDNEKDTYKNVFNNLIEVLEFLNKCFNHPLGENLTTLSYIGKNLQDNLSEAIIKNCLNNAIPSNADELLQYKTVIDATEILEKKLIEYKIFDSGTCSILKHANNVDIIFINKTCQDYILNAILIAKKDLLDMVEVGTPHDAALTDHLLFQRCYVSRSCIELLQLAEKIIQQSTSSTSICGDRLYCTVQNIFNYYANLVQEHQHNVIETIPQQVALFYNNCMYISYKLIQWHEKYKDLPALLNSETPTFNDKAYLLRSTGKKVFVDYVQQQINEIETIMIDSGIVSVSTLYQLEAVTEKCIMQCITLHESLKTVWKNILCFSDYNKTIGLMLNFLCNFIINAIVNIKNIACVAAEQLAKLLKVILIRGPALFSEAQDVCLYVEQWYKMNELVFILGANLMNISERWTYGKGPLALRFKPEEMKQLIEALFQDTTERADLLHEVMSLRI